MAELRIPLDPCNPAQFYACCGLIELFEMSGVHTVSKFETDWRRPREAMFALKAELELRLTAVVTAVRTATYKTLPRPEAEDKTPESDSIAPVQVSILGREVVLDWWLEWFHHKARHLKCWAGQVTTQKLFSILPMLIAEKDLSFDAGVATTTRFGIDPRSAWVALNLGYSPNEQGQESRTYPAVEMLGAFGLQGFRPAGDRAQGFTYHLWLSPLPQVVARTVCAQTWSGCESSAYRFSLGERGSYKYFSLAEPITSQEKIP
jgi:CRISPR-associated protein Csx14